MLVSPEIFVFLLDIVDSEATYMAYVTMDKDLYFSSDLLEYGNEEIKNENIDEEHVKSQENVSDCCFCYLI
jgi:hypothetical protein